MKEKEIFLKILLLFFGLGIFLSVQHIVEWLVDSNNTKEVTKLVRKNIKIEPNMTKTYELVGEPEDKNDAYYDYVNEEFYNVDFTDLKEINSNVVGYILVPGTTIDYPVVQTSDNKYYLRHSFDNSYNRAGWIFMDYRSDPINYGKNTIIYGHKRKDGTMFSSLSNVLTDDWFNNKENHIIKMSNDTENTIWKIFSVYKIEQESYYLTTRFATDKLYQEFLDTIKGRSIYDFNTEVTIEDKILTLSTCYDYNGMRVVVHAKLMKRGY